MKERSPSDIIGRDRVLQLIFEGYAIVPIKLTEAMDERMAKIADGPLRSHAEVWSEMLDAALVELPERGENAA